MPNSTFSKWMLCECLNRPRATNAPPFFFQEIRIGMLVLSMLFNLVRLIYEARINDISVILVAARLFLTALQLVDQWWFCKNWESFFIEKKMRAYMWFRFFLTVCMFSMLWCLQTTFPPYPEAILIDDAFLWISGLQAMVWYYWGKYWNFSWGDMSDDRRIRAIIGTMFTTSIIYAILSVYIFFTCGLPLPRAIPVSSITATIAFCLMGFAFRYLNIITNRSSQACVNILKESSKVNESRADASEGSHHSDAVDLPSSPPPAARRQNEVMLDFEELVQNKRHSLDRSPAARRQNELMLDFEELVQNKRHSLGRGRGIQSSRPEPSLSVDDVDDVNVINDTMTMHVPHEGVDIEYVSVSSNNDVVKVDERVRVKPTFLPPSMSINGSSRSNIDNNSSSFNGTNNDIALNSQNDSSSVSSNVGHFGNIDRVRVKPNNAMTTSRSNTIDSSGHPLHDVADHLMIDDSSGHPLHDVADHLMIDDVPIPKFHVPKVRQNSLDMNLANYETAHLLSDKIVVVAVQVSIWTEITLTHLTPPPMLTPIALTLPPPPPSYILGGAMVYIYDDN